MKEVPSLFAENFGKRNKQPGTNGTGEANGHAEGKEGDQSSKSSERESTTPASGSVRKSTSRFMH